MRCKNCGKDFGEDFKWFTKELCSRACLTSFSWKDPEKTRLRKIRIGLALDRKKKSVCDVCGKEFRAHRYRKNVKFCSLKCYGIAYRGRKPWNTGLTQETDIRVRRNSVNTSIGIYRNTTSEQRKSWSKKGGLATARRLRSDSMRMDAAVETIKRTLTNMAKLSKTGTLSSYESRLEELCKKHQLPFRYTGDGSLWMTANGKHFNPDFMHENQRLAIEVYETAIRDHFHRGGAIEYERQRQELFKKCNFSVMFLTRKDLFRDNWEEHCISKLNTFVLSS